jgi:hypothetical protein
MTPFRPLILFAVASVPLIGGCATSKHDMAKAQPGQVSVCTKCYSEIRKVQSTGGPRGGLATNRTITTHRCEECKSDMTIYAENGVMKVRCATCAPEGVDCDRCVPKAAAK